MEMDHGECSLPCRSWNCNLSLFPPQVDLSEAKKALDYCNIKNYQRNIINIQCTYFHHCWFKQREEKLIKVSENNRKGILSQGPYCGGLRYSLCWFLLSLKILKPINKNPRIIRLVSGESLKTNYTATLIKLCTFESNHSLGITDIPKRIAATI